MRSSITNSLRALQVALIGLSAALIGGCSGTDAESTRAAKTAALQQQLAALQAEASRIRDSNDIKRLQRIYGYYVSAAQWDQAADLFADDGTIEIGLDGVYEGKERIRDYFFRLNGGKAGLARGQLNEHLQLQPVVHVSADGMTAKGRWRALIAAGQYKKSALWGEGTYENEYVKQDGVWKIKSLHWYPTFMSPYEGGWAKKRDNPHDGKFVDASDFPPDRPPTETYEPWPGVYVPPFHYPNPGAAQPAPPADSADVEVSVPASSDDEALSDDPVVVELRETVAALAHRIQLLKDLDAIENLQSAYGYYLDKALWDDVAELFAEDGSIEISQRGVYVGKKRIRESLQLYGPQGLRHGHLHNHIQLQPATRIAPDGKTAVARVRAMSQLGTYGGSGVWGDSVYDNEYVKENGVWKIRREHLYTIFFVGYDGGWVDAAFPAPQVSKEIPPDQPPTVKYEPYPAFFIPPFPYDHPVTGNDLP